MPLYNPPSKPGGSTTDVQYNNSGVFGGDGNLTWDGTNFDVIGNQNFTGASGSDANLSITAGGATNAAFVSMNTNNTAFMGLSGWDNIGGNLMWRMGNSGDSTGFFLYTNAGGSGGGSTNKALSIDFSQNSQFFGTLSMNSHQINNVTDPTSAQDAATKNYVDSGATTLTNKTLSDVFMGYDFRSLSATPRSITLLASTKFEADRLVEIASGSSLQIPSTSSLEITAYTTALNPPKSAIIATSETTASASYTDLATVGPTATVTIGPSGNALVFIGANMANNTGNDLSYISFAVSGASTVAASDQYAIIYQAYTANALNVDVAPFLVTGLAAGTNEFTAKYKTSAGTGTYGNRIINVIPL